MEGGGRDLGYEVLNVSLGERRHSWHCHHHERELHDRYGIRFAPGGFIERYDDAIRVAELFDSHEVGCERGVWRPWKVLEYDLVSP